jgi:NAD(P)-dependent dehydrogenase (short-subunit alcohol dehydrogenase family)/rhamnose utilization protein RhaD (predicted bifunctional aldolase and dehydrogenase)
MQTCLNHDLNLEIQGGLQVVGNAGITQPGFSLGIKTSWSNRFGLQEEVLLFAQARWPGGELPAPEDWACLRLAQLRQILTLQAVESSELSELVNECRCFNASRTASVFSLFHAAFVPRATCFSEPTSLLMAFARGDAVEPTKKLPFEPNLLKLGQQIRSLPPAVSALILDHRGLLAGADTLAECLSLTDQHALRMPGQNNAAHATKLSEDIAGKSLSTLPELRSQLSALRGRPLVLHLDDTDTMRSVAALPEAKEFADVGLPFPDFFNRTGNPLWLGGEVGDLVDISPESQVGTTIAIQPGLGVLAAGNSPAEAQAAAEVFKAGAAAISAGDASNIKQWPDPAEIHLAAEWEQLKPIARLPFSGEIALVTGAASGIGKAVVQSLLERGSAVAGVDINPTIKTTFNHPSYFGIVCDVASEESVCQTLNTVAKQFGGLDMLILNAGLFPSGCNINKLSMAEFTKVINVNFTANMVLMREAHPLLLRAPRYGRVVVIGSKNLRAPGPGAAAYSTSKAALTQLARVAALEWGSDGIRVNVIHPDAVFDTALYTEEVLQARAAHYGMTVDQYKKRNLLKTKITSHDVAEMVAEMCGQLFYAMTGGQIQFDGGNDRTL